MANRNLELQLSMMKRVAVALGPDFCQNVVFVGGCTTGLFVTDEFTLEQVRHTEDVDLIVNVIGRMGYYPLQEQLRQKGFKDDIQNSGPICAMKLGELRVDLMPTNKEVLGFGNRWYPKSFETATDYKLDDEVTIRLVTPVYFIATKFEAFLDRGKDDLFSSQDLEDILTLFDGRSVLVEEIREADNELKNYIAQQVQTILEHQDFSSAVDNVTRGDHLRNDLIYSRLEKVASWISE